MIRIVALACLTLASTAMAQLPDAKVYAAGSLRAALMEAAIAYRANGGGSLRFEFGPSGALRDRLAKGEPADVFASANMEHPESLARGGTAGPVRVFARNRLCALAPARLAITSDNVLDRMLDPKVKLGTSTPKSDPAGDYAWQVFERADKKRPGSFDILSKKALQLVGGSSSPSPPANLSAYTYHVKNGDADIFLTYCTNALLAKQEDASLASTELPEDLAVGAAYGVVVMRGATSIGESFARFMVRDPVAQGIFAKYGFSAPGAGS